jgi:hypothetical protein
VDAEEEAGEAVAVAVGAVEAAEALVASAVLEALAVVVPAVAEQEEVFDDILKITAIYRMEHSFRAIDSLLVEVVLVQCQSPLYIWQAHSLNPGFSGGKA